MAGLLNFCHCPGWYSNQLNDNGNIEQRKNQALNTYGIFINDFGS